MSLFIYKIYYTIFLFICVNRMILISSSLIQKGNQIEIFSIQTPEYSILELLVLIKITILCLSSMEN